MSIKVLTLFRMLHHCRPKVSSESFVSVDVRFWRPFQAQLGLFEHYIGGELSLSSVIRQASNFVIQRHPPQVLETFNYLVYA